MYCSGLILDTTVNRIGTKASDPRAILAQLRKAGSSGKALQGRDREETSLASASLRDQLMATFTGVDASDGAAMKQVRHQALPMIVRSALGERATDTEVAHVSSSLERLFATDERLSALLTRAVLEVARG